MVKYDYVPRQKIQEGIFSLSGQKASIVGYVFNDFPETYSEYGYGRYGYGRYGYGKYGYGKYGYGKYGSPGERDENYGYENVENEQES